MPYSSFALFTKRSKSLPWARISIKKIVGSRLFACSLPTIASLVAYMQHTEEHQLLPLDMAEIGAGSRKNPFKLDARNDVFVAAETVFAADAGIKNFKARGGDYRAHFQAVFLESFFMPQSAGNADLNALVAFGTDPAIQAAAGFAPGIFFREAYGNLLKIHFSFPGLAHGHRQP